MNLARGTAAALATLLGACTGVPERVILLPDSDGKPGSITVSNAAGRVTLDQPYAMAIVDHDRVMIAKSDARTIQTRYRSTFAAQPTRPQSFTVYFVQGGDVLTTESQIQIERAVQGVAAFSAAEVIVVGHTDRVGTVPANDALSVKLARVVRDLLVERGIDRERISVTGRGEREPLVATEDEVGEPRNRRVEIKLR